MNQPRSFIIAALLLAPLAAIHDARVIAAPPNLTLTNVPYRKHERNVLEKDPTHTSNAGVKLQGHCAAKGVPCERVYPGASSVKRTPPPRPI